MLAHELSHVVQQGGSEQVVQRYRGKKEFDFGKHDTPALKEETFTNAKKQPWIQLVEVNYDKTKTDNGGESFRPAPPWRSITAMPPRLLM